MESVKEYQKISGKHLNIFQRFAFKASQKQLQKNVNANGMISNKFMGTNSLADSFEEFNVGGFLLGLFLFLPGVLIAYLIGGDEDVRRSRTKWAWYGTSIFVIIALAALKSSL